jgi:hypothetical protein
MQPVEDAVYGPSRANLAIPNPTDRIGILGVDSEMRISYSGESSIQ